MPIAHPRLAGCLLLPLIAGSPAWAQEPGFFEQRVLQPLEKAGQKSARFLDEKVAQPVGQAGRNSVEFLDEKVAQPVGKAGRKTEQKVRQFLGTEPQKP